MTYILEKSDQNFNASDLLFKQGSDFNAPTIHSSYYSCVQLMIHIIITIGEKTEDEMEAEMERDKISSHKYYIREVTKLLRVTSRESYNRINDFRQILLLKDFRKISDYKNKFISDEDCKEARGYAFTVRDVLNDTLGI